MASKLEYLQRYMSSATDADAGDKKKKRRKKTSKKLAAGVGTRVVDVDHAWEQAAPSKDAIEHKWELDAAEDERPLVVAAAVEELVDPQDLPVYVNSEAYLDELRAKKKQSQQDADGDLSPPRKQAASRARARRSRSRSRSRSSDAASPPRKPRKTKDDDASPPRKRSPNRRHEADDDASPPRKPQQRRRARDSEDDMSPPRRRADKKPSASPAAERLAPAPAAPQTQDDDVSPPRRSRRDASPSREQRKRQHSPSPDHVDRERRVDSMGRDIPMRRSSRSHRSTSADKHDVRSSRQHSRRRSRSRSRSRGGRDVDASPPRRSRGRRSPSRSRERARDPSPRSRRGRRSRSPRKSTRWGSPHRTSSRRERSRSRSRSDDTRRRGSRTQHKSVKETTAKEEVKPVKRETTGKDEAKPRSKETHKEVEEKKAGLFTAAEFDTQRKLALKRKDMLNGADAKDMGANAETVYRDKRGRKLDMLNEMVRQQEVLEGKREREAREEYEWGTGEVQKRERLSKQQELELMKQTPFARHEDDEELERKRRERVRAFDPMHSKVFQEDKLFGDDGDVSGGKKSSKKKRKSKGKKDKKSKPKYAGPPAPPNRFGIMPGYRWDGVVRGTGWEEKLLLRQNASTAVSEEAYKYAVADM